MKFAVVEYSSKSGKVWRHTEKKPNYLADPEKEIDATSFGCYVSALGGEHIPLLGLITGSVNTVSPPVAVYRKIYKRLTKTWPTYSISYLAQFDALLIVHQLSNAHELTAAIQKIKQLPKPPLILGVPTQPFGIIQNAITQNKQVLTDLEEFMDACDIFISIVKDTLPWYTKHTETKTIYLPQPYPVEYASNYFQPIKQKRDAILLAGITEREHIMHGHRVAHQLQKRFPDLELELTRIPGVPLDTSELGGSRYTIKEFQPWQQHLKYLSRVKLVINTDHTKTRGRVQVDCAAVGTPSIGANSDAQRDLFPSLPANRDSSVNHLLDQATHLLMEKDTYERTVNIARHALSKYSYETSANRLREIIQAH